MEDGSEFLSPAEVQRRREEFLETLEELRSGTALPPVDAGPPAAVVYVFLRGDGVALAPRRGGTKIAGQ